ncbi:LuxR C-terminal-related transcriptional regulator [Enterobacter bugandensis]|uniref:response regulator transcription factor n=1 Tax=Enterobacter bugandensis TaxID=881260 RepID=UPI002DB84B9D|nr:LuxR C-terminal-related transcriptional regulator [Enterobacter bugandensis]WRU09480.1 LuxR C-terminal-related transcriptional regulator [Enterobacter bugandensis]
MKTDVLVMEVRGNDYTAADTLRLIYRSLILPHMPKVMLLTRSDAQHIFCWQKIFSGLPVLSKKAAPSELKSALNNVMNINLQCRLSPREFQVMYLLCAGFSQKQASHLMDVSPKTVCSHKISIQKKISAKARLL